MDHIINRKQCKEMALRIARDKRQGWQPTRVSKEYLDKLEAKLRNIIIKSIQSHRSVGKTIIDLI